MKTENTQHTPGPWKANTLPDLTLEILGKDALPVAVTCFYRNGTQQANARLIAAAPELLAASINALALLAQIDAICITGKQPAFGVIRELARDAAGPVRASIARATGKEGVK